MVYRKGTEPSLRTVDRLALNRFEDKILIRDEKYGSQ